MEVDGVTVRELLGDFSHRLPCDRPQPYVLVGEYVHAVKNPFDRSETREPVSQQFKGKPIVLLKGKHSGKCVIAFNGESLKPERLHEVKAAGIPIIGMNRTYVGFQGYTGPECDYLCVVDHEWFLTPEIKSHPGLINGSDHKGDHGYRVTRHWRMSPFSTDLGRDGYPPVVPCTTGFLALMLAHYLGFSEVYCLGLDMTGGHFDGSPASRHFERAYGRKSALHHFNEMLPVMEKTGTKFFVCDSPDSKAPLPKVPFEAVFA